MRLRSTVSGIERLSIIRRRDYSSTARLRIREVSGMSARFATTTMSASHRYRGRRAAAIENDDVRVTVLEEGGHIAEILDKRSGVNPLWTPPWASIEPSTYLPSRHAEYGAGSDAVLLA